jgi:hypothetical protein
MTVVPIGKQRIEARLNAFDGLIDMSDYENRPLQRRTAFLSRALAAFCIKMLAQTDLATAAGSITDMFNDRGIDAIHYDTRESRLFIVQSKWSESIDWKASGEFVDGVRKLIAPSWESFANNAKISGRRAEIDVALQSSTRITLVSVHIGSKPSDEAVLRRIDELAAQIDGGSDIADAMHWHQRNLLDSIKLEADPPKIDAALTLANWSEVKEPYQAVFGRVQGRAVAQLFSDNPHLAHSNIRKYGNRTDVNSAIAQTLAEEPHHFWYFNNGLTIICDEIKPAIYGRTNATEALFRFSGISLVNGAQTTGTVSEYLQSLPEAERDKIWIQIRAVSLRGCPEGFATRITKYTNLQNAVSAQDFVSLDPIQSRLATDFAVEKRRYVFKWGEPDPANEDGCTLREATTALACADPDFTLAVQVKREISVLWQTESKQYRRLFHDNLTATKVWNAVRIMRSAESRIRTLRDGDLARAEMVAWHLQRIILHLVFQSPLLSGWDTINDPTGHACLALEITSDMFARVCDYLVANHPTEYLASLSKNFEKCGGVARSILTNRQENLFDGIPK